MAVQTTLSGIWGTNTITVNYGILYNYYATVDPKLLANVGWRVPTSTDIYTLHTTLGGTSSEGGKLKEVPLTYWTTPNTGATDSVGFHARGGGLRLGSDGTFDYLNEYAFFRATTEYGTLPTLYSYIFQLFYDNDTIYIVGLLKTSGTSIRLIKETTTLSDGEIGYYIGNDGKSYSTICIGTQEWLSTNLIETKYRDLSAIPEVTNNATWSGLSTGALCAYNNDWTNL